MSVATLKDAKIYYNSLNVGQQYTLELCVRTGKFTGNRLVEETPHIVFEYISRKLDCQRMTKAQNEFKKLNEGQQYIVQLNVHTGKTNSIVKVSDAVEEYVRRYCPLNS